MLESLRAARAVLGAVDFDVVVAAIVAVGAAHVFVGTVAAAKRDCGLSAAGHDELKEDHGSMPCFHFVKKTNLILPTTASFRLDLTCSKSFFRLDRVFHVQKAYERKRLLLFRVGGVGSPIDEAFL